MPIAIKLMKEDKSQSEVRDIIISERKVFEMQEDIHYN